MKSDISYYLIKTLKRQNFTFLKIADFVFNELKVQTFVQWFFSDGISVFACYLTLQVAKLREHAPSQRTPRPNSPHSPL